MWFINSLPKFLKYIIPLVGIIALVIYMWPHPAPAADAFKSQSVTAAVTTTTTTTIKPDGTKITKVQEKTEVAKVKEKATEGTTSAPLAQYRAGLNYQPDFSRKPQPTDVEIEVGARLGESPLWLNGSYSVKNRQMSVGVSVEW